MLVVSDTSPLNYLVLLDVVGVLRNLYGQVVVPEQVLRELSSPKAPMPVAVWLRNLPTWMSVRLLRGPLHPATASLDAGEAAATTLAIELGATKLLVDEIAARRIAKDRLQLNVVGTIGVLQEADDAGLLDAVEVFQRLKTETNFRASLTLEEDFYTSLRSRRSTRKR